MSYGHVVFRNQLYCSAFRYRPRGDVPNERAVVQRQRLVETVRAVGLDSDQQHYGGYRSVGEIATRTAWLTVVPADSFAPAHDAAYEASSAYTAEDGVGLDSLRELLLDLVDHASMPLPQNGVVVGRNHHPVSLVSISSRDTKGNILTLWLQQPLLLSRPEGPAGSSCRG